VAPETADRTNVEVAGSHERFIRLGSVIDSLAEKGFELEPDHRVSYRNPIKALNVFVGKVSDRTTIDAFKLPYSAVETSPADGSRTLTLMIREAGTSMSA